MTSALLLLCLLPICAQPLGVFFDGYQGESGGIGIDILLVHTGPRCKAMDNCDWMVRWSSKRYVDTAEIAVTVAGRDAPVLVAIVPGGKNAKLDEHNPVFDVPLATVSGIDFILRNGTKKVGHARFPVERKAAK